MCLGGGWHLLSYLRSHLFGYLIVDYREPNYPMFLHWFPIPRTALVNSVFENFTSFAFNTVVQWPFRTRQPNTHASAWQAGTNIAKNVKIHEASTRTVHTDANDDNEDTAVWAMLLNRERGEDKNDKIHQKMEQTRRPTMAEGNSKVDNAVPSYTRIESIVATQVAHVKE